jgi:hypothetical protein
MSICNQGATFPDEEPGSEEMDFGYRTGASRRQERFTYGRDQRQTAVINQMTLHLGTEVLLQVFQLHLLGAGQSCGRLTPINANLNANRRIATDNSQIEPIERLMPMARQFNL